MTNYKSMPTLNLKKMNEASSESVEIDPHLYRQLIGSLMYLVNTIGIWIIGEFSFI
jgi:hypothetical protein